MTQNDNVIPQGLGDKVFRDENGRYFAKGGDLLKVQPCETCGKRTMMGDVSNDPSGTQCILKHDNKYHRFCSERCVK